MGRVWGPEAIAKNEYISIYGNIVSLIESPLVEGLIYAGTDDGLVQVTEDGGQNWRKIESFPGIPANTYVADLHASPVDPDTVFAVFNNHKRGDFKPYLLKSTDRGKTWTSIAGNLEEPHILWTVIQDSVRPELLFAGSDFGLFVSIDGGGQWVQLKGGLPTIPIRDLEIQKREGDLACASFGRGFFILDDITPLRLIHAGDAGSGSQPLPREKGFDVHPNIRSDRLARTGRLVRRQSALRSDLHLLPQGPDHEPQAGSPGQGGQDRARRRRHLLSDVGRAEDRGPRGDADAGLHGHR